MAVSTAATKGATLSMLNRAAQEFAVEGMWTQLPINAEQRKPVPRYEHGAALIDGNLYVVGGNYGAKIVAERGEADVLVQ